MAIDLDLDLRIEPAGDRVGTARVDDPPMPRPWGTAGEVVEAPVELTQRSRREVDDLDGRVLALRDRGHQASAFSHA